MSIVILSSLALPAGATDFWLTVDGVTPGPDAVAPQGWAIITVVSKGHPERIAIDAITPSGDAVHVESCVNTATCVSHLHLDKLGLWVMVGTIEFAFFEPDGGTYVNVVGTSITIIDPTVIFADDLETGTTSAWSQTIGGTQ